MKNVMGVLGFIAFIAIVYVWNSASALNFALEISVYLWVITFVLSVLVFLPASFIRSAKDWCSNWFIGVCFFQIINFILTIKYLLIHSGEMSNLDGQRWPSPIMLLISLYRVTIGAGFEVYWQLIAMIIWGSISGVYGEKLDIQYQTYKHNNKNNPNQVAKSKYLIVAISTALIILTVVAMIMSGRAKPVGRPKVKSTIIEATETYQKSGMIGLRNLSETQYEQLSNAPKISEIQKCAWTDIFGIMLNQQFVNELNFPQDDYFNVSSFQQRIGKYLIHLESMEKANQYLKFWESEVLLEFNSIKK